MKTARILSCAGSVVAALVVALPAAASHPLVPALAVPRTHPVVAPVAGQSFELTFPVVDALTGAPLTNVTSVSFQPTIAGKPVLLQQTSFVAGYKAVAGVVWMTMNVPAATAAEQLTIKVTVEAGGLKASRTESYRIRPPAV